MSTTDTSDTWAAFPDQEAWASFDQAADLAAMTTVTKDVETLTLAIRAGYDAAELQTLDLANPDTLASLTVAAALNADVAVA